jgi:DMSO/TMAO reductase YedYZ molybdopterin-dependent catalytic subunit
MARTTAPTETAPAGASSRSSRILERVVGGSIGVLSAAVAIGVAQVVAGTIGGASSPIVAVGSTAIDATPEWLKSFAIRTFGSNDKLALVIGIDIVLLIAAVVLGIVSVRRPRLGIVALIAFGALGALAALTRPENGGAEAIPTLVGTAAGVGAFLLLRRAAGLANRTMPLDSADRGGNRIPGFDRRRFLWTGIAAAGVAAAGGEIGRLLIGRADASDSRAAVRIPTPVDTASPVASDAAVGVRGVSPFITPNDRFYRVDTALFVPAVTTEGWSLNIHGMVDHPITLSYDDLIDRPLIERDVTLACVSNEVGGDLVGNARWIGAPLKDLLEEAGVAAEASQIVSRSVDGFTVGTPTAIAMDGRDAMLAISMNGQPLPIEHGFPVRMVVPGLYGYVSATKWVVDLELTTFEAYDAYWIKRGWAQQAPIKTESRIDTPKTNATVAAGAIVVAGVAWAQHRGIERVEVQVDGGAWMPAELGSEDTIDTWRQWMFRWDAPAGAHTLAVRATDGTGGVQTATSVPPFPNGASGYHTISVSVR